MKKEDVLEIAHKLNHTYQDDTPFLMRKGDQLFVIGNARKTALKKYEYTLEFENESGEIYQEKFRDIYITPRRNFEIIDTILKLFIIFNKVNEDGTVVPRDEEELLYIFETEYELAFTYIQNVVEAMFEVELDTLEDVTPDSLIKVLNEVIDHHPEIFNEADIYLRLRMVHVYSNTKKKEGQSSSKGMVDIYFTKLDTYGHMAQYVGKILKMRPNDILDNWGVAELIVTFGTYRNEESYQNFVEWQALSIETKKKVKRPEAFAVKFYTNEDLNEEVEVK